ncbi:hypothetical protein [Novosphingobium sp. ZW T3_23]|uniref:hypothetical protein n=1 Tax=Novosphingobium sp. ZW T3_23 TaxID=3378084 RepID=UPI003854AF0C
MAIGACAPTPHERPILDQNLPYNLMGASGTFVANPAVSFSKTDYMVQIWQTAPQRVL